MNNKLTFCTIFWAMGTNDFLLFKDPGQIPFNMQESFGYKAIVPLSSQNHLIYGKDITNKMVCPIIKDHTKSKNAMYLRRLIWLLKNAKKISVLHLFYFDMWTSIFIFLYKLLNHKGVIYVHCDSDGTKIEQYLLRKTLGIRVRKLLLRPSILKDVLWGIQNKDALYELQGKWPFTNIQFIPNGCSLPETMDITQKENTLLTVARLGTAPKNTDMILEAFAALAFKYPDWNLKLVGPIEESFQKYIDDYFAKYPNLSDRIIFTGNIGDRNVLTQIYCKSKIFLLPSSWEGFSLSIVEAMYTGNFIVGSNIPALIQATDNAKYGLLHEKDNLDDFICKLDQAMSNESHLAEMADAISSYAVQSYSWENILTPVDKWIKGRIKHYEQ